MSSAKFYLQSSIVSKMRFFIAAAEKKLLSTVKMQKKFAFRNISLKKLMKLQLQSRAQYFTV
jgi:hypothetical protein